MAKANESAKAAVASGETNKRRIKEPPKPDPEAKEDAGAVKDWKDFTARGDGEVKSG